MKRKAAATVAALLGPLFLTSFYLLLSRWPERWYTAATDWIALGLAILIGVIGLWWLPLKGWQKAAITLLYVPAMGALLTGAALLFVCGVFGDCL